jgi:hypothetical protein
MGTTAQHVELGTPSRKTSRTTQPWMLLVAALSLMYHAAPTSAFLSPSTLTSSISASIVTPNVRYRNYSPTSRILHPGKDTAIFAATAPVQPLMECYALFTSAAFPSSSFDIAAAGVFNTDNIKVAFSVATFFPQLPWLFLILLPNANVTKKLMGGYGEKFSFIFCLPHYSRL